MTAATYLSDVQSDRQTFGTLRYRESDRHFTLHDMSAVARQIVKRVLPGSQGQGRGPISFAANRRAIGDLNWFMLRYPLNVECPEEFRHWLESARDHDELRTTNLRKPQKAAQPEEFRGELLGFQREAVSFLTSNKRTLLADEMGLGKTISAIASMLHVATWPALVVCPPVIRGQWVAAIRRFADKSVFLATGRTPRDPGDVDICVISYNLLQDWCSVLKDFDPRTIVFDELQELRHIGTAKYSAASTLTDTAEYVWGLSGTPIHNHGIEIWSVINVLDFQCLGSRDSFSREWCHGYGSEQVKEPKVLGEYLRQEGLFLRRRKHEVDHNLPPKHRVAHRIGHDERTYESLIQRACSLAQVLSSGNAGWSERGQLTSEIGREFRQATGLAKVGSVVAFVRSLLQAGHRPLIYAWHHDVHDGITGGLADFKIGRITGKETAAAKQRTIAAFQDGSLEAVLLSLRATAGIDGLQKSADVVVFAELDWSPAVHAQCEDRLHRFGMQELDHVMCFYLVTNTGFDSVMMDALGIKTGQFVGLMGDPERTEEDEERGFEAAEGVMQKVVECAQAMAGAVAGDCV